MASSQFRGGLRFRRIYAAWLFAAVGCGTANSEDSEWLERSGLPLQQAESFEGTLRMTVVDPVEGDGPPRIEEYLELTDGRYVRVEAGGLGSGVKSGQRVRTFGRFEGERIRASRIERLETGVQRSVETLDEMDLSQPLEAVTPRPTGASKKIAVILVSLPGAANNFNPDQVRTAVFGATGRSARTFWEEGSFGKLTIRGHLREDGDVFGPYAISGTCSYSNVVNASAQAAMAAGVDLSPYDHVVRYTPANASGCAGGGQGDQPGKSSIIYGVGINALWDYVGHEVGHNFGCGHASSYDNCQGRFAGSCQHNEYGDPTDIMGRRNGYYMSYYKNALGWLEPENHVVVTSSRQVRLYPIERPSSGLLSVLVRAATIRSFTSSFGGRSGSTLSWRPG